MATFADHRIEVRWSARRNLAKLLTPGSLKDPADDDGYAYNSRTHSKREDRMDIGRAGRERQEDLLRATDVRSYPNWAP